MPVMYRHIVTVDGQELTYELENTLVLAVREPLLSIDLVLLLPVSSVCRALGIRMQGKTMENPRQRL